MIYYPTTTKETTHTILACVSKGYDLAFIFKPQSISSAESILEKWSERYGLLNTPQQQYRKFLTGQCTFSCIVINYGIQAKKGLTHDDIYRYLRDKSNKENKLYNILPPTLILLCRVNDLLLKLPDGQIIDNKYNHLDYLNAQISKQVKGSEKFEECDFSIGSYDFVALTKRAKNIKELQAMNLTENSKHATDFTWRLNQNTFDQVRQLGVNLVNNYQKTKSTVDVRTHFEDYLKTLEGYIGYRGVRVQIGKLYASFCSYFKAKMNQNFLAAGGRKLNLAYVRASTPKIPNNTEIHLFIKNIKDKANEESRTLLAAWKKSDAGAEYLMRKVGGGYVYEDSAYRNVD